jgi:class 3 adenylate cyclase
VRHRCHCPNEPSAVRLILPTGPGKAPRPHEVDTQGDAFLVAFATALGALDAAEQAHQALRGGAVQVRIGVHTGTPLLIDGGYVGVDLHRAARIAAAGHGGQTLVSASTAELAGDRPLLDLGMHPWRGMRTLRRTRR